MKAIKVQLKHVKTTKGTQVYGSDEDGAPIRSLYITRSAMTGEPPSTITVTVDDGAAPRQRGE